MAMITRNWKSFIQRSKKLTPSRRVGVVGVVLAGAAIALLAYAAVLNDTFEIDQDATATNAAPGDDWDLLLANGNASGAFVFDSDPINSSGDDNFSQGGSKDVRDISSAGITNTYWLNTTTAPPDKDDIEHAFAASYTAAGSGDLLIYFGADRFSNSGDSAIGFWFFQAEVSDNNNSGVFSGKHTVGDILVTSDFRQGGGVGVINVFEWIGTQAGGPLKLLISRALANGAAVPDVFCNTAVNGFAANVACATSNRTAKAVPGNWTDGYTFKGVGASNQFPAGTFFEGGVNITALFPNSTLPCFTSFLAMTRTSASTTAQLKDYVAGSFPVCGIDVGKACDLNAPPSINSDGTSVHTTFAVPITNSGSSSVYNVKLTEDALSNSNNLNCSITKINGSAVTAIPLSATVAKDVQATLAPGATVTATVECNSLDNPMYNEVTASATTSSSGGTVLTANHPTTAAEECAATVNPSLDISKTCIAPVTVNPTTLKPHVCVDIVVTNTSAEKLIEGTVVDDKLGTLASNFTLNPGAVLELKNKCYDTYVQDDQPDPTATPPHAGNSLPEDVIFSDTATANARGALSGVLIGDPDAVPARPLPFATAHCPLCPHD
jgi:hypothetical protein